MRNTLIVALAAVAVACLSPVPAGAGPFIQDKCRAAQLKAAGKDCDCRHGVTAKAVTKGGTPDFTKCATKLADAFSKVESKGGCPSVGASGTVDGRLAALVTDVGTALQTGSATGDAARCAAAKLKAAGKKCACVHKAQATAVLKGTTPDFTSCDAKLDAAYAKIELKAAGACPTTGDADAICDAVEASLAEVEADVADRDTTIYSSFGPYHAGVKNVTFIDTTRATPPNGAYGGAPTRTLETTLWYPVSADAAIESSSEPIIPTGGPFPLIIRAHGFSGFAGDSHYLLRQLTSWGYVVVEPNFPLSNLSAPGGPTVADIGNQAGDVSFLIDTLIAENANSSSFLYGRIDTDRIGAIGHSLGGATVILATYHSTLRDPRIDATVALSPLGCVFLDGFFDSTTTPLMIEGGTVDMITPYNSNHLQPYGYVNAPKYLVTFAGGTHLGFSDRLLFGANQNGDDAVGCNLFVQPGDPRPITFEANLPPDFLGGPAAGVDPSGSMCEAICPLPPPSFMLHSRQSLLAKAASIAFFENKLRGSISGHRMITSRLATDNADLSLAYEE